MRATPALRPEEEAEEECVLRSMAEREVLGHARETRGACVTQHGRIRDPIAQFVGSAKEDRGLPA